MPVRATAEIEPALASLARMPIGGLMLTTNGFTVSRNELIADLATRYRLPSVGATAFARQGGLMGYGADIDTAGQFRQAASYPHGHQRPQKNLTLETTGKEPPFEDHRCPANDSSTPSCKPVETKPY